MTRNRGKTLSTVAVNENQTLPLLAWAKYNSTIGSLTDG